MPPNQIREHVRREPFHPFRVYVSDGAAFDVRQPENVLVTRRDVAIASEAGSDELPKRMVFCDPSHITRFEPLSEAQAGRG